MKISLKQIVGLLVIIAVMVAAISAFIPVRLYMPDAQVNQTGEFDGVSATACVVTWESMKKSHVSSIWWDRAESKGFSTKQEADAFSEKLAAALKFANIENNPINVKC